MKTVSARCEDKLGVIPSDLDITHEEQTMEETHMEILLLMLDTMLGLEKYIQKMGAILAEFLQNQTIVTTALSHGLSSTKRDQVQIALSLVVKAGKLSEFPLTLLGDSVVAQNVENSKRHRG